MNKHDATFLKHFAQIIAFLFSVMVGLILWAMHLHGNANLPTNPRAAQDIADRTAPEGDVYTGDTGRAAIVAAQAAALAAAKKNVPFGGSTDGATVFNGLCSSCHGTGALGAPKLEKAAWTARVAQGTDTLIKHATEGFKGAAGEMPARGNNPALTDEQVANTVKWMVANLK